MTDRFTLRRIIPNGGGTQDQVIAEPGGWVGHTIKLERHPEFHSLIEYINSNGKFIFTGTDSQDGDGGAEFIRMVERLDGVDATLKLIVETAEDDVNFRHYYTGLLQLEGLEELPDNEIEVPVVQDSVWTRLMKHWDTKVDLTKNEDIFGNPVDPAVPITVRLPPQPIRQKFVGELDGGRAVHEDEIGINEYIQLDFDKETLSEIEEKFNLPIISNPEKPVELFAVKYAGEYSFNIRIEMSHIQEASGAEPPSSICESFITRHPTSPYISVWLQINNNPPTSFGTFDHSGDSTSYVYSFTHSLKVGDHVRIYAQMDSVAWKASNVVDNILIWGSDNSAVQIRVGEFSYNGVTCQLDGVTFGADSFGTAPSGEIRPTFLEVTADTIYPETQVQGFFVHDLFSYVIDRLGIYRD